MPATRILGIDPDTYNCAVAVVECYSGMQGFKKPCVLWVDVAPVKPGPPVDTRISILMPALDYIIGNLGYDLPHPRRWEGIEDAVVESQWKYPRDSVRPNNLISLAQVGGICAGMIQAHHGIVAAMPRPQEWKGTVPKKIHQERTLAKVTMGVDCGYLRCNKTQQGHLVDAIGLALWGYETRNHK